MSGIKTDVNPSDIGTKALERERLFRTREVQQPAEWKLAE